MASRLLAVPAALLFSLASYPCLAADGTPLGWVERGQILPEHVTVKFKLDTGALTFEESLRLLLETIRRRAKL